MIRVLFVCVRNSARSQMAEGLANSLGAGNVLAMSAGSDPGTVHELAIEALREIGIDISGHKSKSLADVADNEFDYIITLCEEAEKACPVVPGTAKRLHWFLPDPAAATGSRDDKLDAFRTTRNELTFRVKELLISA